MNHLTTVRAYVLLAAGTGALGLAIYPPFKPELLGVGLTLLGARTACAALRVRGGAAPG